MKGRWITENSVIAHKLLHKIKTHKAKNRLMVAKIDMKKAFDRLDKYFVDTALATWGFSYKVRWLIFNCLSTVEFTVLLNGSKAGSFEASRGLR